MQKKDYLINLSKNFADANDNWWELWKILLKIIPYSNECSHY